VIDDVAGNTIVSASTIDPGLREQVMGLKQSEKARLVGKTVILMENQFRLETEHSYIV
jgi:large subunit ribosomal protein L18